MSKAAEAFRTISEVAAELAVPKHVLRFWEAKFPQIRPMKRGGGRRYYRPGDMELLKGIRHLLHAEGYTIKGVQKILREQGVDAVKAGSRIVEAERPASEARQRRVRASDPAPVPAPPSAIASRHRESAEPADRELLRKMISELEACRRLLIEAGTEQRPGMAGRSSPRVRSGRS